MQLNTEKHGYVPPELVDGDVMDSSIGKGIASIGVAAAVIYGLHVTHDGNCFFGFIALAFIWGN